MALLEFYQTQYLMMIPAVLILLFLSFLEKRQVGRDKCGGRPALFMAIPSIDGFENRAAYAVAFGVSLNTAVDTLFFKSDLGFTASEWTSVLYGLFQALIVCVITLPFSATISTSYRAAGALINILYSITWFCIQVTYLILEDFTVSYSKEFNSGYRALDILILIPYFICQLVLISYCCYIIYRCFRCRSFVTQRIPGAVRPHQVEHVLWVLRKNKNKVGHGWLTESKETFVSHMNKSRKQRLITNFPFFKYPTKMLICFVFQLMIIFLLTLILTMLLLFTEDIKDALKSPAVDDNLRGWIIGLVQNVGLDKEIETILNILEGTLAASTAITIVNSLLNVLMFFRNYRYHMLKLYQGDKAFTADWQSTPQSTLASSMSSLGNVMVFTFAGWILCLLAWFLSLASICGFMYLAVRLEKWREILKTIGASLCVAVIGYILSIILIFICKKFLLQRKLHQKDKNPPFNVDNRKLYELINYFYTYVSMTKSVLSCCRRFILSAIFAIHSLGRLDKPLFSRDLQKFDSSHGTYLAMLKVDHAHNNPSMRLFAHLLWSEILVARLRKSGGSDLEMARLIATLNHAANKVKSSTAQANVAEMYSVFKVSKPNAKLARTRWFLAYTLLRNPQLKSERIKEMALQNEVDDVISLPVTSSGPSFNYSSFA